MSNNADIITHLEALESWLSNIAGGDDPLYTGMSPTEIANEAGKIISQLRAEVAAFTGRKCEKMTVGLMFCQNKTKVALIRKARPEWMAGCWNGLGGHIKPDETGYHCIHRKVLEESGILEFDWEHFAIIRSSIDEWSVDVFRAFLPGDTEPSLASKDDEPVQWWPVSAVLQGLLYHVDNLPLLVAAALDRNPLRETMIIEYSPKGE